MAAEGFNQEAPPWLKSLPVAPEYRPTLAEFRDPIGYILKIEREASRFGICKIVPPVPPPPKKTAAAHLARSFAARHPSKEPAFTTRQQQVGFCPRRPRPVQKPVWQSGDWYTLPEFEAKAKQFEKSQLRKCGKKSLAPLEVEALFWKACAGRPFSVEYANDLPGSGFAPIGSGKGLREAAAGNVGETAWNMRGVSRAEGSLLRFMKEEIPGVTSPMVYVAMMFSWFAWHVEDHELHSLNYLHMGAGKTWYGVPRDARLAFEDVVRVHGYGEEVNPLVTFATLGEKTTVMSPEVLISAGIPCCRLVQNAGEFVVTFPGAYHSGFSHGFNCGEAANIATPEWLKVAKEAAIRRASTNCPPMVSHFQLLYALALSLCSRMPVSSSLEPRSSRLKDKMRCEGEIMVKDTFIRNVIENNSLLSVLLDKGSYCIVLPQKAADSLSSSDSKVRSQVKVKPRMSLGLWSHQEAIEASGNLLSGDTMGDQNMGIGHLNGFGLMKGNFFSIYEEKSPLEKCSRFRTVDCRSSISDLQSMEGGKESTLQNRGLLDQGLLSCVTCGILSFACMAVLQPSETAARFFMSADCSSFNDQTVVSGEISDIDDGSNHRSWNYELLSSTGGLARHAKDRLHDDFFDCSTPSIQVSDHGIKLFSDTLSEKKISALELLASAYGNSSDSEDEEQHKMPVSTDQNDLIDSMLTSNTIQQSPLRIVSGSKLSAQESGLVDDSNLHRLRYANEDKSDLQSESLPGIHAENPVSNVPYASQNHKELEAFSSAGHYKSVDGSCRGLGRHHTACLDSGFLNDSKKENSESGLSHSYVDRGSAFDPAAPTSSGVVTKQISNIDASVKISDTSAMQRCDKDSSRMHIFCLEHAIEVEKQLRPKGGVHIMLLCHPDYPKLEVEAKLLAEELEMDHQWKDIPFREATKEDQERIQMALEAEEAIPTNSDWAVKMGINLYYSASLSKAPLYSKQMPYNAIIYRTFSCNTRGFSPVMPNVSGRKAGRQKKIVAGKWCGKVWMSNQVHPFLVQASDDEEEEDVGELQVEGTDPKPESEIASANSSRSTRKSGRKRKKSSRKSSAKRNRCNQSGNNSCNSEDAAGDSSAPCQMVLRSRASSCKKIISWHRKSSTSRKGCDQPGNGSSIIEDSAEDCSEQCGKVLRSGTSSHKKTVSWHKSNLKDKAEGAPSKHLKRQEPVSKQVKSEPRNEKQDRNKKSKTSLASKEEEVKYACDVEGCSMSFSTKQDLALHKRNICPVEGCRKKFFSHKYMVQHRKVHMDDRPLKCPWKGCKMSFKWPWARTEHIRVHTGDRPYICREAGCGQTFRFVSDFSRHKRKTGHVSAKRKRG